MAAWPLLAVALAGTGHKQLPWPLALLAGFVAIMLLPVRSALRWWVSRPSSALSNQLTMALVVTLSSAWVTASVASPPRESRERVPAGPTWKLIRSGAGRES
jgi:hypothetical protein